MLIAKFYDSVATAVNFYLVSDKQVLFLNFKVANASQMDFARLQINYFH
jgi:hypothetical protein